MMSFEFEFSIPLSRDDLLNRTGVNQYVVDEVYTLRRLPVVVQDYKNAVRRNGALAVLDHFDGIFSVLMNWHDVDINTKTTTWELLLSGMSEHTYILPNLVDENTMDHATRLKHLNAVKMHSYLLCQMIEAFENVSTSVPIVMSSKGRKKKSERNKDLKGFDWESQSEAGVQALLKTLQLNIHRLWEPPVAEEEFINMVTCCCYKLLENQSINRNKGARDNIFHLIGIVVKKYNHSLSASLKIIQLLQHFEHLASPLVQAVDMVVTEYGTKTIVGQIMREIGRLDPRDLARDNSATHTYCQFLVELSEKIPAVMLPNMSVLVHLLDDEPYTMRNAVLSIMGQILIQTLSGENLDNNQKSTRDSFLDHLEEHIHDVHAFVRSKVLQIWLNIVENKALPLTRQQDVVEMIVGRLEDTSSQVRKYAIQFVTKLLQSNPFAAKLSLVDLKENYEKEKTKLIEMMPKRDSSAFIEQAKELEEEWDKVHINLKMEVNEYIDNEEEIDPSLISDGQDANSVHEQMRQLLREKKLVEAIRLLMAGKDAFPDDEMMKDQQFNESQSSQESEDVSQSERILLTFRHICLAPAVNLAMIVNPSSPGSNPNDDAVVSEISKQQVLVQYLKDTFVFAGQVQHALGVICQLLGSKVQTDILEAIEFFVTSFDFGVVNAMRGVRAMLALVWSRENKVKEAVVDAYKRLYLKSDEGNYSRTSAIAVVNNLTALTIGASKKELASLEELVCEYVKTGDISDYVVKLIWERFTMKILNTTPDESRAALVLLGMTAKAEENIASSNIDILVSEGLGPRAMKDLMLARDTCIMLQKIGGSMKPKAGEMIEPFRLPENHSIFTQLQKIMIEGFSVPDDNHWVPMAEQAVNVIYKLAERPDVICGNILKLFLSRILATASEKENPEDQVLGHSQESRDEILCSSSDLTKIVSLVGHISMQQLIYLDVAVFGEFKRRHGIQDEDKGKAAKKKRRSTVTDTVSKHNKTESTTTAEAIEDELGLTGGADEDAEAEYIRNMCETDLVTGKNLLSQFAPILISICSNPSKFSNPQLQAAATLALAKFMLVSSEFCDSQLQLLFTILEKSQSPTIRANTIIAVGDLTFRFPNNIEPWTGHLYARLRDESTLVRRSTLTVLTHLILNDMVKVKGQISEMGKCIMDDDPKISGLAKLFFHELSRKGNAVYNNLPDMISRLSDPEIGVSEEQFQTIMKYLFGFIQKDKHSESLVEKLCHRFKATRTERQARDLALCLSMLNYSDRSIHKIQENFACYADKLFDEEVFNFFQTIMANGRKFAKLETKTVIEELEARLQECHLKGADAEAVAKKASKASAAARFRNRSPLKSPTRTAKVGSLPIGRSTRKKTASKPRIKFNLKDDDDDVDDNDDDDENADDYDEIDFKPIRLQRPHRTRKNRMVIQESDSDLEVRNDEDEMQNNMISETQTRKTSEEAGEDSDGPIRRVRGRRKGKSNPKPRLIDSDEDDADLFQIAR